MRIELDEPSNIIRSATRINSELLNQSGSLGVIAPGAYADQLVIDGDPLRDLTVLTHPGRNLKFIMKGGIVYKNELDISSCAECEAVRERPRTLLK